MSQYPPETDKQPLLEADRLLADFAVSIPLKREIKPRLGAIGSTIGVSTAEGGRGHVTQHKST